MNKDFDLDSGASRPLNTAHLLRVVFVMWPHWASGNLHHGLFGDLWLFFSEASQIRHGKILRATLFPEAEAEVFDFVSFRCY